LEVKVPVLGSEGAGSVNSSGDAGSETNGGDAAGAKAGSICKWAYLVISIG
jgi:hypothetical protein